MAGEKIVDFTAPGTGGDFKLSAHKGHPVVLYFYPKDDTPGCTTQACGVRDHRADYAAAGATVLGVSRDSVRAIKKFQEKHGLDFTLLSDADHATAEAYGIWVQKSMYGREYMGNERTTFVISPDGTIKDIFHKVKAAEQVILKNYIVLFMDRTARPEPCAPPGERRG